MNKKYVGPTIEKYDVVICGGGAAGMLSAIQLKMLKPELSVVIVEKNTELGRKVRATGNGRCNISNTNAEGYEEIMEFMKNLGLVTRTYDNGLVYPYSESAADVVKLLRGRIDDLGVTVITGATVSAVEPSGDGYAVKYSLTETGGQMKRMEAKYILLALGGKAGPAYGTTGDGYSIARSLGHTVITPVPVLTGIECREWAEENGARSLAGVRCRASVKLYRNPEQKWTDEDQIFEECGEVQFTKYGLSGICVFNTSRHMRYNRAAGESMEQFLLKVDLYDGDIYEYLEHRVELAGKHEPVQSLLMTLLKEDAAAYVLACAGVPETAAISDLSPEDIERIAEKVHGLDFHPTGVKGWKEAQASAGGVSLEEISQDTCESKLHKGLFIAGELADYDGPCGGYNLSNAWLTGLKTARGIANESL